MLIGERALPKGLRIFALMVESGWLSVLECNLITLNKTDGVVPQYLLVSLVLPAASVVGLFPIVICTVPFRTVN